MAKRRIFVGEISVLDAAIKNSTVLYFETETSPDAVGKQQPQNFLDAIDEDASELQRLIVLTPDETNLMRR